MSLPHFSPLSSAALKSNVMPFLRWPIPWLQAENNTSTKICTHPFTLTTQACPAYPSYSSPWSPQSWTWWAGCSALRPPVAAGWPAASGNCTSECFWRRCPASPCLSSSLWEPPSSPPEAPSAPPDLQNYRQAGRWTLWKVSLLL